MGKDCCNIFKIVFLCLLSIIGILSLIFIILNCRKCKCIKGKASQVFNDMGDLIGELSFKRK